MIDTSTFSAEARVYVNRLQAIIERDRTEVARALVTTRKAIVLHEWLRLGRGSYEYDDDRWRDEFGAALNDIEAAIAPLKAIAANLSDSPLSADDIARARAIPMSQPDIDF